MRRRKGTALPPPPTEDSCPTPRDLWEVVKEAKARGDVATHCSNTKLDVAKARHASEWLCGFRAAIQLLEGSLSKEEAVTAYMDRLGHIDTWTTLREMGVSIDHDRYFTYQEREGEKPRTPIQIIPPSFSKTKQKQKNTKEKEAE